jgi:hypothetical protein
LENNLGAGKNLETNRVARSLFKNMANKFLCRYKYIHVRFVGRNNRK